MDKKIDRADSAWPIVDGKDHEGPSVFRPEALLREARRQRRLSQVAVPEICVLDPDGDVVRRLKRTGAGRIHEGWACYHTELLAFDLDGLPPGANPHGAVLTLTAGAGSSAIEVKTKLE